MGRAMILVLAVLAIVVCVFLVEDVSRILRADATSRGREITLAKVNDE